MDKLVLKAKKRETGKSAIRKERAKGLVPGIYYTKGDENIPILVEPLALRPIVFTRVTRIFDLEIEGENEPKRCLLKDVAFDPITDSITHFDLLGIKDGQEVTVTVPFILTGQSEGVRQGGVLQHVLKKIKITSMPENLPEKIEVDISKLKIGQSVNVGELNLTDFSYRIPNSTLIVAVSKSRASQSAETTGEGATQVEEA